MVDPELPPAIPTRADYEASICRQLSQAELVPFRLVSLPDGDPTASNCHSNVDRWVEAHPGTTAVRGWVAFASCGDATGLTAHSVVRDTDGQLFDITPLGNECDRAGIRFVSDTGGEQVFGAMKGIGIHIWCPSDI